MKTLATVSFVFLTSFSILSAQTVEHYFRLEIRHMSELDDLTLRFSIDRVDGNTVYGYANDKQWEDLQGTSYSIKALPHPGSLYEHQMSDIPFALQPAWDTYPTYDAYVGMMVAYALQFPAICRLDTLGTSVQDRLLLAMKITDNPDAEEDEPEFFYTSTMHGDETVGYVLMIRLIDYLLNNYGQATPEGERVTRIVDEEEVWINPLSNPDGTYRAGNQTVTGAWRYNSQGVDLNRDFPDRISDPNNTTEGREVETQHMMNFMAPRRFTLSANFHGGAQVVNYPWDNGAPSGMYSACPEDAWFIDVSRVYATPNQDIMSGGFANGITNGCDWYAIFGGRQDWIYHWHGGRETTIELFNTKNPAGSVLPERWNRNQESFLAYMEEGLKGIRGVVTDASTGFPLFAEVEIVGIDNDSVFTDPDAGDYHRLLLPGTYTMNISAEAYQTQTTTGIVVQDGDAVRVNAMLVRDGGPPFISDIADQTVPLGGRFGQLRVDNLVADPDDPDSVISWSWSGNINLIVQWVSARRRIRVRAPTGWSGSETITFTATDPGGLSDSDVATFTVTTGVDEAVSLAHVQGREPDAGERKPEHSMLEGNYPNPFNPKTAITFAIPVGTRHVMSLQVFDLLGREVATLANEEMGPGTYTREWDAAGQPSGVYFYRLSTSDFVQTRKLVLLR